MTIAVVCGSDHKMSIHHKDLLKKTGLIHLVVVSASHLLFLEWVLIKLRLPFLLRLFLLIFYSVLTLLQPPVLRSLLALVLTRVTAFLFWRKYEVSLISTLSLFFFDPKTLSSYSALLSSAASLANSTHLSSLKKQFFIYILLLPPLVVLSAPHPIAILMNLLLGPVIGYILFPLSLLSFALPLQPLLDFFWKWIFYLLEHVAFQGLPSLNPVPTLYIWFYVLALNIFFIIKDKYENHQRICSSYNSTH